MERNEGRPLLKMTGHRSAKEVDEVFASYMVDVAYVIEATPEVVYIVADDPDWPANLEDYNWLCSIVKETLAAHGSAGVELSYVPGSGQVSSAEGDRGDI